MVSRSSLKYLCNRKRSSLLIGCLILFVIGCSPASPTETAATPPEATRPPETPTPAPEYAAQIHNGQYQLGLSDSLRVVQLTDGKYETGAPGAADYVSVTVLDFIARGDLNADGTDEIAVAVAENYGGTGVFVFVALYAELDGHFVFQTSTLVDDRPAINALSIEDGDVYLDAVTHESDDPFCCPTLRNERHYRLINNQLQLTEYVTFTPDGRPRTITIESPVNGEAVFSSVQITGSVAISPFENTLAYRIFDVGGVELSAGSLMVTASDLGAPGTFNETILLGNILSGVTIRIEIQDISAKDGSLLAMDSVELVVK